MVVKDQFFFILQIEHLNFEIALCTYEQLFTTGCDIVDGFGTDNMH